MDEGTKLGEFKDNTDFNSSVTQEVDKSSEELTATKIGEVSDFEKSLSTESESKNDADADSDDQKMESIFEQELTRLDVDFEDGDVVSGIVRSVEKGGIIVDIGYKSDGFISNNEYSNDPDADALKELNPGDEIQAVIIKLETKEGFTRLSKKRAEYELFWNDIAELAKSHQLVTVKVQSKVEGGLVVAFKGVKGFIPASQVLLNDDDDLDNYINQSLEAVIIRADRKRKKVIFSVKQAKAKLRREESSRILDELENGQVRDGKVTSIKDFGAFVDLGGVEGLVHISELSWSRVSHPSEILSVGDSVKVFILGVDKENYRVSLGMKQLEADPWVEVSKKYSVGDVVSGTVTRTVTFGAFVKIDSSLEGLIHISELSDRHVEKVGDVLKPGQQIEAKIIKLLPDEQKIGLSLKLDAPVQQQESASNTDNEAGSENSVEEQAVSEDAENSEESIS